MELKTWHWVALAVGGWAVWKFVVNGHLSVMDPRGLATAQQLGGYADGVAGIAFAPPATSSAAKVAAQLGNSAPVSSGGGVFPPPPATLGRGSWAGLAPAPAGAAAAVDELATPPSRADGSAFLTGGQIASSYTDGEAVAAMRAAAVAVAGPVAPRAGRGHL